VLSVSAIEEDKAVGGELAAVREFGFPTGGGFAAAFKKGDLAVGCVVTKGDGDVFVEEDVRVVKAADVFQAKAIVMASESRAEIATADLALGFVGRRTRFERSGFEMSNVLRYVMCAPRVPTYTA
jgi:hypothetical protein